MKTTNNETFQKLIRLYDARDYYESMRENANRSHNKYLFRRSCKKLECIREEIKCIEDVLSINK